MILSRTMPTCSLSVFEMTIFRNSTQSGTEFHCLLVVINWMNGAWEVKGEEHAIPVRGVVAQFVRWFLGGTFRPRTDENDWCRHIFRESNKAADTHANCFMDNGDSGPGAQWEPPDLHDKMPKITSYSGVFPWGQKEERAWYGCLDSMVTG